MANRTKRTPEKDEEFFALIEESGGNVTKALDQSTYCRTAFYEWKKEDPEFAKRVDDAIEKGVDALESEAVRRARDGVDEPVYYQGSKCGVVRKYSDTLLIFLLKGKRPDTYRERLGIDFAKATPQQIEDAILAMSPAKLRELLAKVDADSEEDQGAG